jgi:hypothetical protein
MTSRQAGESAADTIHKLISPHDSWRSLNNRIRIFQESRIVIALAGLALSKAASQFAALRMASSRTALSASLLRGNSSANASDAPGRTGWGASGPCGRRALVTAYEGSKLSWLRQPAKGCQSRPIYGAPNRKAAMLAALLRSAAVHRR